eukprot:jgi/Tetstr1/455901/TSEL_042682.t1
MATEYDVAVVGGGVVGCAVLRALQLGGPGRLCILLERDAVPLGGASARNSGIWHCGFDAMPGTLEAYCLRRSNALAGSALPALGLERRFVGALVIAWAEDQLAELPALYGRTQLAGFPDVELLAAEELYAREANLRAGALGGLFVPGESIVDPWAVPAAYLEDALQHGAELRCSAELQAGEQLPAESGGGWRLCTAAGEVRARVVVNCAGLYGDTVEGICAPPGFTIQPRLGQFVVFGPEAHSLVSSIIMPLPTKRTKGVLASPTVSGHLLVGPTATETTQRDNSLAPADLATEAMLQGEASRMLPAIEELAPLASYSGIRPATQHEDYQIYASPARSWITVAGIRSTGLSASLGIGEYVNSLYEIHFGREVDGDSAPRRPSRERKQVPPDEAVTHPVARLSRGLSMFVGRAARSPLSSRL